MQSTPFCLQASMSSSAIWGVMSIHCARQSRASERLPSINNCAAFLRFTARRLPSHRTQTDSVHNAIKWTVVKVLKAVHINPSQSYGGSPVIWDHTVIPATRHRWPHPALTPAGQAGTRFTYPGGMEGWVDLSGWLYVYQDGLPVRSHPPILVVTTW